MIQKFSDMLSNSSFVLKLMMAVSILALAAAFASEAFLGLEPCILCIYQRWPYAVVIALGALGLALKNYARAFLGLSGLSFLVNSGIAAYHTGVEQKWWASAFEGCSVPAGFLDADKPKSILENIMSAPAARCDQIPWQDPLIGLSMANYNALLCFALFLVCAVSFMCSRNTKQAETGHEAEHENGVENHES